MRRHCFVPLLFTPELLLCGCASPIAQDTTTPKSAADSVEESNIITLHGHLVCTYMHHFFKADAGTRESLHRQNAPEWMFEKLWDEEDEYQEHEIPDPEAYYTFRTPYRLTATENKLTFSEIKGGAALTLLELPCKYPEAEKAPLLLCTASQNPPGSFAGTILCRVTDGKSLVIVPEYDKYQAPVCISWRNGSPRIEELVCYRSSLARSGIPTVLIFEGGLGNTPIFQHYRADGLSM